MRDERRDIVGHQRGAERSIDVSRPAVALEVDADDLPSPGERGEIGAEHLDRAEPAVQQDERPARSMDLVVELDAVHVRVAADALRFAPPGALSVAVDLG